jgi:hypothetical protein
VQRTRLIIFGALFAVLVAGVALAVGIGSSSPDLPPGAVAIVEDAPPGTGTISKAELDQAMLQAAGFSGQDVPMAGEEDYEQMKDEAMTALIINVWLEGQAEELGVEVTGKQIAERLRKSGEASSLRKAHFTAKTIRERVKVQLDQEGIMEKLGEQAAKPTSEEIRGYYDENPEGRSFAEAKTEVIAALEQVKQQEVFTEVDHHFPGEWQPRTHCAEGFVVEQCAGYPTFAHSTSSSACNEADPKQPPEACPAPVAARIPAMPGTVRPWRPEGDRLVQRPYPEVIEGEASGE